MCRSCGWRRRPATSRANAANDLAAAVKLEVDGDFAKALPIVSQPARQQGTLGAYAIYYKGFAELRLGRPADARLTFQMLRGTEPGRLPRRGGSAARSRMR
jgi:hypothetical protein